jgi:solute carrier family 34 (sodium-dependent phosphate cotransporter)
MVFRRSAAEHPGVSDEHISRAVRSAGPAHTVFKIAVILCILYAFLVSIGLMGAGFKIFGKDFARALIETTSNPFIGLFVGIFSTAIIQSSSTTTSMVVAFVAAGSLTVGNAVPIVMGANIGTGVTATFVSLGHVTRRNEFKNAYSAAVVHDMFNLLAVAVFLPLELATGFLSRSATELTHLLAGSGGVQFRSPLKAITKPVYSAIADGIEGIGLHDLLAGGIVVVLGVALLITSLIFLSRTLKSLVLSKLERFFARSLGRNGYLAILIGLAFTTIVQSSSITTSLMVPMAAAGVMRLEQVFPVALGANLGTTVTALLAALATGCPGGLTIALVHLLFNLSGIVVFYPLPPMRRLPIVITGGLSDLASRKRVFALLFVAVVYFAIPGALIFLV